MMLFGVLWECLVGQEDESD